MLEVLSLVAVAAGRGNLVPVSARCEGLVRRLRAGRSRKPSTEWLRAACWRWPSFARPPPPPRKPINAGSPAGRSNCLRPKAARVRAPVTGYTWRRAGRRNSAARAQARRANSRQCSGGKAGSASCCTACGPRERAARRNGADLRDRSARPTCGKTSASRPRRSCSRTNGPSHGSCMTQARHLFRDPAHALGQCPLARLRPPVARGRSDRRRPAEGVCRCQPALETAQIGVELNPRGWLEGSGFATSRISARGLPGMGARSGDGAAV